MPPKTQTKKALVEGLKTNCKRGYNLLAETQAELTATQKWIIDKLLPDGDCTFHPREKDYYELTRFLTDLNISIKVPMLTILYPYTNKQGKTTMKHYTANGSMVNHLKDDKPVLYPTWIKFNDRTLQTNEGGYFISFADQTVYTLKEEEVEVAPPVEVEVEVAPPVEVEVDYIEQESQERIKHEEEQLASIAHINILSTETYRKVKNLTKAGAVKYCKANKIRGYANFNKKDLLSYIITRQVEALGGFDPSYITEKIRREEC